MLTLIQELEAALPSMNPQRKAGFERLVRDALDSAKSEIGSAAPASPALQYPLFKEGPWAGIPRDENGFPQGYFETTAGCFENEIFERGDQVTDPERKVW